MKIHVQATLVPPPEYLREGAQPHAFEIDADLDTLPARMATFVEMVIKAGSFAHGGSVAFLVQPRRSAINVGGMVPGGSA